MESRELKDRVMRFAIDMSVLCRTNGDWSFRRAADQMFRSATSVAANYHAACRARSRREFISKMGIVVEEAEETMFWLEYITRAGYVERSRSGGLIREAGELLAIFTASAKTAALNERAASS